MPEHALFNEYVLNYDIACRQGLRLTGEDRDYFARRRVEITASRHGSPQAVRHIIDFGCGLGQTVHYLLTSFPNARVTGLDPASDVIAEARARYTGPRVDFRCDRLDDLCSTADLVYCNGVFHHIPPTDRVHHARRIHGWLRRGGMFALWENNPWNPGTRMVMSRIPFDRDAIPLSHREGRQLVTDAGFHVRTTRFYFYFPAIMTFLRPLERSLTRIPLGGQYCVFSSRAS
jgi:SAM-dependent methyltransferase